MCVLATRKVMQGIVKLWAKGEGQPGHMLMVVQGSCSESHINAFGVNRDIR